MTAKKKIGDAGEDFAASYLKKKAFHILARNWRKASYELDLVCQDKDELVFVEVRTRKKDGMNAPSNTISQSKQKTIIKAARLYLAENFWEGPCRFDVLALSIDNTCNASSPNFEVEHLYEAFDTSHLMDSGDTSW